MFIETLEFTIPVDLCDLFSTLKRGPRSNLEFPASVNSYGTTQDANIQVALRSNKLTFKVDGVSSNSSMISKSECKTLKLSVFDVDCSLAPAEQPNIIMSMSENIHHSVTHKRSYDFSVPVSSPAPKSRRISEPVQSRHIPQPQPQNTSRPSNNSESKSAIDPPVNVKQEPEDPDLIEIEPDSELNDIVPKKETPYMQIDFSSGVPHTQTSQAALDRLSHQQSSHSQSPASSSSSFHQNVPHVPDYAEPSTSQVHHGDQSADDFLVFQEDNDYGDDNDNEADYSNDDWDDVTEGSKRASSNCPKSTAPKSAVAGVQYTGQGKAPHASTPHHLPKRDGGRSGGPRTRHVLSTPPDRQNIPKSIEKEKPIPDMQGSPQSSLEDYDTIEVLNISTEGRSKKVFVYSKSVPNSDAPERVTFEPDTILKPFSASEHAYSRGEHSTLKHQTPSSRKEDTAQTAQAAEESPVPPKVLSIIVNGEVMFSCSVCGHVSPKISEIDQHIMAAHNKIPVQQLTGSSSSVEDCYKYSKSHGWWTFSCLLCTHIEHDQRNMVRHVQYMHFGNKCSEAAPVTTSCSALPIKESSSGLKKSPVVRPPLKSVLMAKDRKAATVQNRQVDDRARFNCYTCDYHTNRKSHFNRHEMSIMHLKLKSEQRGKTKLPEKKSHENILAKKCYRCRNCKYSCTSESKLNVHKLVHVDSSRKCMICKRAFYSKFHLRQHNEAKHPEKRKVILEKKKSKTTGAEKSTSSEGSSSNKLICGICSQTFSQRRDLQEHVLTHLPKVHRCELCNKRFAFSQALIKHRLVCTEKDTSDEPKIEIDKAEENSEIEDAEENSEIEDAEENSEIEDVEENLETEDVEVNPKPAGVETVGLPAAPSELLDVRIKEEPRVDQSCI
ncbi:uncharacterized protein LOC124130918 isoform X1 [Haliotis rufescens]|uniref:uncharacterized protein LOC124130918 isoform X1 n=1 Tax=Haliotis rufescens TaxID=6454 RepID=UPI00201E7FAC|nr:uncharacterized protein LOC124130918 isoform X1 [Haliotis rufescens]